MPLNLVLQLVAQKAVEELAEEPEELVEEFEELVEEPEGLVEEPEDLVVLVVLSFHLLLQVAA